MARFARRTIAVLEFAEQWISGIVESQQSSGTTRLCPGRVLNRIGINNPLHRFAVAGIYYQ